MPATTKLPTAWLATALLVTMSSMPARADIITSHATIAAQTPDATRLVVVDSGHPGPTVLVISGIHGNEPAGPLAAQALVDWPLALGKLIVVPRANVRALRAHQRLTPGDPHPNLNRNFPCSADDTPRGELATELWNAIAEHNPDWVIDLHEGFDFHISNNQSVGSSILHPAKAPHIALARDMLDAVNATVAEPTKKFVLLSRPEAGSLARCLFENLGIRTLILETTRREPIALRVRQHHIMVAHLLRHVGLIEPGAVLPHEHAP